MSRLDASGGRAERFRVSEYDRRFRDLLGLDPTYEVLGEGFAFTEGPLWHPAQHYLLFTDIPNSRIHKWSAADGISLFRDQTNKANGLTYDRTGALLLCEHATSRVTRLGHDGRIEVLASHFQGKALNSPNDIVVASTGDIFFTDPIYGRLAESYGEERPEVMGFRGVYRLDARTNALSLLARDFDGPNGLCFSRDETRLYVNDSERNHIRVFEQRGGGGFTGGEIWAETRGSEVGCPDGMKADAAGNVYCSGPGGIHVFSEDAECFGIIHLPSQVANFTFGGPDLRGLFVTARQSLYRLRVSVPGIAVF